MSRATPLSEVSWNVADGLDPECQVPGTSPRVPVALEVRTIRLDPFLFAGHWEESRSTRSFWVNGSGDVHSVPSLEVAQ